MILKICIKCNKEKSVTEFYKHSAMKNGSLNKCKDCCITESKKNRIKNEQHYIEYEKKRSSLPKRKELNKKTVSKFRKDFPEKYRAQSSVGYNIKVGKLVRQPCAICGELKVHAHHTDYSKPLEVVWLCPKHHKEAHKKL